MLASLPPEQLAAFLNRTSDREFEAIEHWTKAGIVQDSLAACGFETRSQIIWAKNNFAIGRGHYHCKAARHRHERTLLPSHTSLVPAGILWRSGACISPSMVAFMEPTTPSQRLPIGEER